MQRDFYRDFDGWNRQKKHMNKQPPRLYTVREVWWCRIGVNVGTEQDGGGEKFFRPVVVLRAFGPEACLIVPLTTSHRIHAFRLPIGEIDGKEAHANISQLRVIDTRRLPLKIGFLEERIFERLRNAVKELL